MKNTRYPLVGFALCLVAAVGIIQAPPVRAACGGVHGHGIASNPNAGRITNS